VSANPFYPAVVNPAAAGDARRRLRHMLRVVPIWRTTGDQAGPAPENPDVLRRWATEDRVYAAECQIGRGEMIVCSLRLMADPAGRFLLERLARHIGR